MKYFIGKPAKAMRKEKGDQGPFSFRWPVRRGTTPATALCNCLVIPLLLPPGTEDCPVLMDGARRYAAFAAGVLDIEGVNGFARSVVDK
jgi:hypothetical protein